MPRVGGFVAGLAAAAVVCSAAPALSAVRLPPLDDCEHDCMPLSLQIMITYFKTGIVVTM